MVAKAPQGLAPASPYAIDGTGLQSNATGLFAQIRGDMGQVAMRDSTGVDAAGYASLATPSYTRYQAPL
jgi:hypothetical protein